jgi:hypothetical protein
VSDDDPKTRLGRQGQAWSDSVRSDHRMQAEPDMLEMRSLP